MGDDLAGLEIDAVIGIDEFKRVRRDDFAGRPIHHVHIAVAARVDQHLARLSIQFEIDEHILVDLVVVEQVVRVDLVSPFGAAGVGVAGKDCGAPEIVAAALVGVPWARIGCAVVDQIEFGIVGDPSPHRAAADLPAVGRPRLHAEILALETVVERLEVVADQHVLVRARGVGAPRNGPGVFIERGDPAAHAHLAAAVADEHLALDHDGSHRDGLALVDLPELRMPQLLAGLGVDRDRVVIKRVEEDLAVVEGESAIDHVAAGNARGCRFRLWRVGPFQFTARGIECEHTVGVGAGIRADHIHGAIDHERRRLLAAIGTDRERPCKLQPRCIGRVDLIKVAIAGVGVIARRHRPLAWIFHAAGKIALCRGGRQQRAGRAKGTKEAWKSAQQTRDTTH
ncbi:hypothetical protein ACVWZ6_007468 [Bradyrhizobium sp. GM6.1]